MFDSSEVHNKITRESREMNVQTTKYGTSWKTPDTSRFTYNNVSMTASDFQSFYCSRQCLDDVIVTPRGKDWCFKMKCFPCDCRKPLCEFYGTCCPDMPSEDSNTVFVDASPTTNQRLLKSNDNRITHFNTDTSVNVVCDGNDGHYELFKKSCPPNYLDDDVNSKCQNDISLAELDTDTFLHVTDNITGYIYYNEYCATCNSVSQFTTWDLLVECMSYMSVFPARTPGELLRLSLASDSGCTTSQWSPIDYAAYSCENSWFTRTVVDTCNVTGEWRVYDENVARACADTSGLVSRVKVDEDQMYKNVFCAICNMQDHLRFDVNCSEQNGDGNRGWDLAPPLPFSILLNFGSGRKLTPQSRNVKQCSDHSHWTSPDNRCFPLQCSPGKILTNGSCATAFSQIRGLLYQIHVHYVPCDLTDMSLKTENMSHIQQTYLNLFKNQIGRILSNENFELNISLTVASYDKMFSNWEVQTDEHVNMSLVFYIGWFTTEGLIKTNKEDSRDEIETILVRDLLLSNITVDIDTNTTLTLMPMLYQNRKTTETNYNLTDNNVSSYLSSSILFTRYFYDVTNKDRQQALILEPQLNCVFVKFDKTQYLYKRDITTKPHGSQIILLFSGAIMTFSARAELNMISIDENEDLRTCLDLLNTTNVIYSEIINNSMLRMSLYLLTLICLLLSIVCLAFTLVTYFLFPVLRSVAGKNNMFLSESLLLAQVSLLGTSHVPETGFLCTFLAICTHFLWLSMFCWCFTCCFHMFCVFTAKTRSLPSTGNSEMTYIIKRIVACSAIPGLTVTGVITTNYAISEGQFMGYGNTSCFLDSQITLIITLVAPLCLILLFNFIFFSITVIKIYNVRKLQTSEFRKDDRNNLYVYVKLSSMTGIFWILSVISEATDNNPLRFIAIGLNGLQGVFIFLSYICNRRVLRLYQKLLGLEKYATTTSTPDRSTIAKALSDVDKHTHECEDTKTGE
ncbi:hypothetical protein BsWGS_04158 [Bradybaena similaris]